MAKRNYTNLKSHTILKDGTYYECWEDQQYSTKYWVLVAKDNVKQLDGLMASITGGKASPVKDKAIAMCMELTDPGNRHNIFLLFGGHIKGNHIVHECVHAKNWVFDYHGVKLDPEEDEHEAYFVDYLYKNCEIVINNCIQAWKRKNKK